MDKKKWYCQHCQHQFEAVEMPQMTCPSCFWSSSLLPAEDVPGTGSAEIKGQEKPFTTALPARKLSFRLFLPWIQAGVLLLVIALFLFAAAKTMAPLADMGSEWREKLSGLKNPLAGRIPFCSSKTEDAKQISGSSEALGKEKDEMSFDEKLSEKDKVRLLTPLLLSVDREPSLEEAALLKAQVALKAGAVESLPSPAWTMERFKGFLAEQQRFYQIPLPGSYKKKLEKLFENSYLPAQKAFEQNDLVQARNLWADSLAFPIYGNDIRKHRGVALTMLRPLVNDTLSKIGALNGILAAQGEREKETALASEYQKLFTALNGKLWEEALAHIQACEGWIEKIAQGRKIKAALPAYPASLAQVDEGIRAVLLQLLEPAPGSEADLTDLRSDLTLKTKVVEGFTEAGLQKLYQPYQEAMSHLELKRWDEAKKQFREVKAPLALVKDAREKIEILEMMTKTFDSQGQSLENGTRDNG